jgi:DNA-binding HxlR family transcriptional regulator
MKAGKLAQVVGLFHHSYVVPMIACLHAEQGAKFVTLVNRLGASRDAVTMTLKYLIEKGIVHKNPGYGHPLRPEYVLTREASRLGTACVSVLEAVDRFDIGEVAFRKWSMPVVLAVGHGASRFSAMQEILGPITPRALTGTLRDLGRVEVVQREINESWPPHPHYELATIGQSLLPKLDRLRVAAA